MTAENASTQVVSSKYVTGQLLVGESIKIGETEFPKPYVGNGPFSSIGLEFYKDSLRWILNEDWTPEIAGFVMSGIMRDFGQLRSAEAKGITWGKYSSKSNQLSLREAVKAVKITVTDWLAIGRIIVNANEMHQYFGQAYGITLGEERMNRVLEAYNKHLVKLAKKQQEQAESTEEDTETEEIP